jgi:alkylation response protein AidB-like acyl-CoA dehydrogenase
MSDTSFQDWPFFDDSHRALARSLEAWATRHLATPHGSDVDSACRRLVASLGEAGWLQHAVVAPHGGAGPRLEVRALCLARDILARHEPLADFAFAMQGLGAGPISLFGSDAQRAAWLPGVATGQQIAAFALSESAAGSDVTAMETTATRDGDGWRLDGEKTWISNGGIASFYTVFARVAGGGEKSFAAFIVPDGMPGMSVSERLHVSAPHPLGRLTFAGCRLPGDALIGEPNHGLRIALGTLDVFRSTVGAAALGMARRALDEAVAFAKERPISGGVLADAQLTRARLASMATDIDASALLVYRAAWTRDVRANRVTREAAMAKWYATEAAQRVVDSAVQLMGARGVVAGSVLERLYREVRSLRIYEGTSEIQQLVIATQVLRTNDEAQEGRR